MFIKDKPLKLTETFGQLPRQIISFEETEIYEITDCLSDILCKRGLLEDDEPNAFGYYVENLIDRFSIE